MLHVTPRSWRYLLPLLLLPVALFATAERCAQAGQAVTAPAASADGGKLLLQFVGTEVLQRQAQHEIDALLQ